MTFRLSAKKRRRPIRGYLVIEAGSFGVHVPHDLTWVHEHADIPVDAPRYHSIEHLGELPDLIEKLR